MNGDNMNNVRCQSSTTFRHKEGNVSHTNIKFKQTVIIKTLRDLY